LQQAGESGVTPSMDAYGIPAGELVVPEMVDLARERVPYDPREIAAAYEAHQRELYSFALGATRSTETAEDVVEEAFLRLIRERSEGRAPSNTRAWLYRVCANLVVSRARRRGVAERFLPFLLRPETVEGPEREYLRRDDQRRLAAALAMLSPVERTALILASRGFSGREVAATIGKSELATRSLMCRARLKLRAQLEREEGLS
jgi:RNA polymerase sigma factor (sigma-70 family)